MTAKFTQQDGLFKRQGIWHVRIMIRGKRYQKAVGPRKEDAQFLLDELKRQRSLGKANDDWAGLDQFTKKKVVKRFREVAEQYMVEREHLKPVTIRGYRQILDNYLLPEFGDARVEQIDEEWIARFQTRIARNVSAVRTNNIMGLLRYILKVCLRRKWIPDNPAIGVPALKERKPDIDPLTMDELRKVLDVLHPHYRPLFTTLAFTGCRPNELFALRWDDVDFRRKQILIRKGRVRGAEGSPKTASSNRVVPMLAIVEQVLRQLKQTGVQHVDGFVFLTKKGQPFNKHVDREWSTALKKARLKHRPSYQLRHTFASYCLQQGCDPAWVGRVLGHATLDTTFRHYARYIENASKANEQKLDQSIASDGSLEQVLGPDQLTSLQTSSKKKNAAQNAGEQPLARFSSEVVQIWLHDAQKDPEQNEPSAPVSLSEYEIEKWWRRRESHSRPKLLRNKCTTGIVRYFSRTAEEPRTGSRD